MSSAVGSKIAAVLVVIILVVSIIIVVVKTLESYWYTTQIQVEEETFIVRNLKEEPDSLREQVAARLYELAKRGDYLVEEAKKREYPDKATATLLYDRWTKLRKQNGFRETSVGDTSVAFTISKDQALHICVRSKNNDAQLEELNTSMFVLLHEMAHMASTTWGHDELFKQRFAELVKLAIEIGIYEYQDFTREPETYCGLEITSPAYRKH